MDLRWWQVEGPDAFASFKGEFITSKKVTYRGTTKALAKPGGNSGAGAVLLAAYYGARRILLLGCDCKYDKDKKRHWHGDHRKGLGNAVSVPKFSDQFKEAAKYLEQTGNPQVINCSPDSAIDFWPKMPIEEALEMPLVDDIDIPEFWRSRGMDFIIPEKATSEFPEGFDVLGTLREWLGDTVVEVGCGYGRLAPAFDHYTGYDINPIALRQGRVLNPDKTFEEMPDQVEADNVLLFTVCLHIPDDDIDAFMARIKCKRLLIAEIMNRKYRQPPRPGEVPAYNRQPEDYHKYGKVIRQETYPYKYYDPEVITWILLDRSGAA